MLRVFLSQHPTIFNTTRHPTLLRVSILSTIHHHSTQYILSRPTKSMPLRVLVSYAPFTDLRPHAFIRRNPHTLFPALGETFILCGFYKNPTMASRRAPHMSSHALASMAACASALRLQAGRRPPTSIRTGRLEQAQASAQRLCVHGVS